MKRVISFVLIILLVLCTGIPLFTSNLLCNEVYADDQEPTLEDYQNLAIATYLNKRNGYITSGQVASGVATLVRYASEFNNSSANNTNIKSAEDLYNHISIGNNSGNYGVNIDADGMTYLNNLCQYLLGKDEFPELYSGGSWGSNGNTFDHVYEGYLNGDSLYYICEGEYANVSKQSFPASNVTPGSPARGQTCESILGIYKRAVPDVNFETQDNSLEVQRATVTIPCQFSADKIINFKYKLNIYNSGSNNFNVSPVLAESGVNTFIYANRIQKVHGNPAFIIRKRGNTTDFFFGLISYNTTTNTYTATYTYSVGYSDPASVNTSVNFETMDFSHDPLPEEDTTFIPTDNGNYYTYNDYSVKNFIDTYIENYIDKRTRITTPEDPEDPDPDPVAPGGTTPPWNDSMSGNLVPDGNGGFNLTLPDLTVPDLEIDWSLRGLTEKFPFSIPFDLMAFFTVLNAEPQTPEIQVTIPLGIWEWNIDWSLDDFNGLARILRNIEFIGFCISLLLITRSIIKG